MWVIGLLISAVLFFGAIYFWLAPKDIFFTFVSEGTAKIVTRNEAYHKTLISYAGHELDDEGFVIEENSSKSTKKLNICGKICQIIFSKGLFFLGFWPFDRIYQYEFTWTSIDTKGDPIFHKKRMIDYIFLKRDVYFIRLTHAEDRENLPLDVEVVVTMSIVSPFVALMRIDRWLDVVSNFIQTEIRSEISSYPFSELINRNSGQSEGRELGDEIYGRLNSSPGTRDDDLNYGIKPSPGSKLEQLLKNTGSNVEKIGIRQINPVGDKYREITMKKVTAEKEAEATKIRADADAYVVTKTASAKAEAIRAIGAANADQQAETTSGAMLRAFLILLGKSYEEKDENGKVIGYMPHDQIVKLQKAFPDLWKSVRESNMEKLRLDSGKYIHIKGSGKGGSVSPLSEMIVVSEFAKGLFNKEGDGPVSRSTTMTERPSRQKKDGKKKKEQNDNEEIEDERILKDEVVEALEEKGLDPEDVYE
jgi:regulator of protease activity HflC (stomatin/prohibitin superfamily)